MFRLRIRISLVFLASALILTVLWLSNQLKPSRFGLEFQLETAGVHASPYTAVILYLVTLSRESLLLDSLASINTNLPGPPWPIILFHTGDYDDERKRVEFITRLHDHIGLERGSILFAQRIKFVRLEWRLPEGIPADKETVDPVDSFRWPGKRFVDGLLLIASC